LSRFIVLFQVLMPRYASLSRTARTLDGAHDRGLPRCARGDVMPSTFSRFAMDFAP